MLKTLTHVEDQIDEGVHLELLVGGVDVGLEVLLDDLGPDLREVEEQGGHLPSKLLTAVVDEDREEDLEELVERARRSVVG